MCSLGPALLLTVVGYVSECGRERMVGLSVQLAFTPQPYPAPVLPRVLLLWLLPRARLRRSVVRLRRCRCSLVVLVTFLRSRNQESRVVLRPVSPSNLTPVSLKTWSSASFSSSSLSSSTCARVCPRHRPCARETSVMYGLGLAFALKPLVPDC